MNTLRLIRALLATLMLLGVAPAFASDADCVNSGGKTGCSEPSTSEFSVAWCPTSSWNFNNTAVYCSANGGIWDGTTCMGSPPPPADESVAAQRFMNYLVPWHNACEVNLQDQTDNYNTLCGASTGATLVNGVVQSVGMLRVYGGTSPLGTCTTNWTSGLVTVSSRRVSCDPGSGQRTGAGGNIECTKHDCPDCEAKRGNPILVTTGAKTQLEADYDSPTLPFVRYYNSSGFFSLQPRAAVNDDYWRHTYSATVIPYTGNAYVLGAVIRPQGTVRYFNLSGVEIQNNDGSAWRLEKLMPGGTFTGWKVTTASSDVEVYDTSGRLASITTRAGYVTTLTYNATSGRLETVTDAYGRSLSLGYNGDGLLSSLTDPAGRTYSYGYDSAKRLTSVTYPGTQVREYLYEHATWPFLLTGIEDERGIRLATYAYDSAGKATSTEHAGSRNKYTVSWGAGSSSSFAVTATDAFGTQHAYQFAITGGTHKMTSRAPVYGSSVTKAYDATTGNISSQTVKGVTTTYVYDATRNLETSRTEASGTSVARTITTTWHSTYRLPATITEPSGVAGVNLVTEFTYDTAGNLTKKKLTAGAKTREWNYTVNARGQVLTIDGPRTDVTDVTTMTYYADNDSCVGCRGQVYTVTNAAGHVTTFNTYSLDSRPTQITDANGVVTNLAYKPRGWLESRTVGGETTTYDYDDTGNLTKVTLPDSSWIQYQYDAANGLVGIDDSLGNAIDYTLDVMGNRVHTKTYDPQDVLRRSMQQVYDGANRLKQQFGAAGQTTTYNYDARENVSSVNDPLSRVTTNTYDGLNRITNVNDPANGNTVYTYDAKDRLTSVKDPKISNTTAYTYDGLGNLLTQVSPDTGTTTFTHDNAGNVATQTDARSVATTYTYDVLNRVTAATVTDGTVTYEYDNTTTGGAYAKGRLTKVTDPSGNTTYVYDSLGRVTSKVQTVTATPANETFTVGYSYSNGRQTGITYPSGRAIAYGFNGQGQVTSVTVDGSTTVLSAGEYFPFGAVKKWTWGNGQAYERTYDLDGRIASVTLGPSTGTYGDLDQVFGYDSLSRLISATLAAGQTQSFTYDANSNRLTATINAATTTYTYPSTSHKLSSLSGATTRSFTYDNAGNVTASQSITYVYDGRGRMKQAGTTTYLVNGLGQRVRKNSGSDLYFAYDEAGRLIGEYDSTGTPIQETVWLGDTPVAVMKPATPSGFTHYYVWADHLGTPRMISDTSNQARWEWAHNDPFGNNLPDENPAGAGAFAFNLRFPGQYFDSETGKHYNYFRDYDPAIGRYVQSDPIGLEGGINTYAYGYNSPVRFTDPTGESVAHAGRVGWALGSAAYGAIGAALGVPLGSWLYDVCKPESEEEKRRRHCQALKDSILETCYGLSPRNRMKCFEAANKSFRQCMGYE
jgi:RHS repeat-associated protein